MEKTKNKWLYVLFRAFTYDLLLYYTLETMFLTFIKGFSFSAVFLITSIDLAFVVLLAIPLNIILKKVSILNRLRLGTLAFIIYLLCFIFSNNLILLCCFVIFKSFGNLILSVNSTNLLDVICKNDDKNEVSKVEGRASAVWWAIEAVGAIALGYLFQINPYISYFISLAGLAISFASTFFFRIDKKDQYVQKIDKQEFVENKEEKAEKILRNLGIAIVALAFVFWGFAEYFGQAGRMFLQDVGASSVIIGYIYFGVKFLTACCNIISCKIQKRVGIKFLPIAIGLSCFAAAILIITFFLNISMEAKIIILAFVIAIFYITRNPYRLNIKNVMTNFFNGKSLENIYTKYFIMENLGGAFFGMIATLTIDSLDIGYSSLIMLSIVTICVVPILIFYTKNLKRLDGLVISKVVNFSGDFKSIQIAHRQKVEYKGKIIKQKDVEGFKILHKNMSKKDFDIQT